MSNFRRNKSLPGISHYEMDNNYYHNTSYNSNYTRNIEFSPRGGHQRFIPSYHSSPKYNNRSPRYYKPRYSPNGYNYHRNRSFNNYSSDDSFSSRHSSYSGRKQEQDGNGKKDMALFVDNSCTENPWKKLEEEEKEREEASRELEVQKEKDDSDSSEECSDDSSSVDSTNEQETT